MPWWSRPAIIGLVLAGLTALPVWLLPDRVALTILAVLLAAIAGVYVGIALMVRDRDLILPETVLAVLFLTAAAAGLTASPLALAAGYFAHGLWDLAHRPPFLRAPGPWWYAPLCVSYDWAVALIIVAKFGGGLS